MFFVQATNLGNRPNYSGYSGTMTSRFFGDPTNVRDMRKFDFGMNLSFSSRYKKRLFNSGVGTMHTSRRPNQR